MTHSFESETRTKIIISTISLPDIVDSHWSVSNNTLTNSYVPKIKNGKVWIVIFSIFKISILIKESRNFKLWKNLLASKN